MIKIKICCIGSHFDAQLAADAGASCIGLVSAMPSGPGVIDEGTIAAIIEGAPSAVETVLLSSRCDYQGITEQVKKCRPDTLQLVDRVEQSVIKRLREEFTSLSIIEVLHVTGTVAQHEIQYQKSNADLLLLDSGNPALAVKQLGGTGRVHDWSTSAEIVKNSSLPVFLAGGLGQNNVEAAIKSVAPYGVDVCSGVRTEGQLDAGKLYAFVDAVHASTSGFTRSAKNCFLLYAEADRNHLLRVR